MFWAGDCQTESGIMRSLLFGLGFCLLIWGLPAGAVSPQTGIYWNPQYPGWALYLENQRGTIFAILYAYSEIDGEPEFLVASGPFLPDVPIDGDTSFSGFFPVAGFGSSLFRVPAGSCLGCVYAPIASSQRVGSLQIAFITPGYINVSASFTDGRTWPNPANSFGLPFERFNFSLGGVLASPSDRSPAWPDLLGEWVFTDQTDRSRPAWRFDFTTREVDVNLGTFPVRRSVVYRDPTRDAVFYCFITDATGLTLAQRNALPEQGCEVRQNGTALFWTGYDLAIDEFRGTLGSLPARGERIYRGPNRVIGRRMSD